MRYSKVKNKFFANTVLYMNIRVFRHACSIHNTEIARMIFRNPEKQNKKKICSLFYSSRCFLEIYSTQGSLTLKSYVDCRQERFFFSNSFFIIIVIIIDDFLCAKKWVVWRQIWCRNAHNLFIKSSSCLLSNKFFLLSTFFLWFFFVLFWLAILEFFLSFMRGKKGSVFYVFFCEEIYNFFSCKRSWNELLMYFF